jgi:hypothetical protein
LGLIELQNIPAKIHEGDNKKIIAGAITGDLVVLARMMFGISQVFFREQDLKQGFRVEVDTVMDYRWDRLEDQLCIF